MAGEASDVLSKEVVILTVENMDTEDLVSKDDHVAMPVFTVNEAPNGKDDASPREEPDVEINVVKLDAEMNEGNHSEETNIPSLVEAEKPFDDDVAMEAQVDAVSEANIETGLVAEVADTEVAVADKIENLDHDEIGKSVESALLACSDITKQSSSELLGQKVEDNFDIPSQVEACKVTGDVVTQESASHQGPNVKQGADVVSAQETNKETPDKGFTQDELPVCADGDEDGSTGCDEALSSAIYTEVSVKEFQQSVVKQSDSILNSTQAKYSVINEESKHLLDPQPQVTSISNKDNSFSFDLPITSEGDTNKFSPSFTMPQDSAAPETVVSSASTFNPSPKNKRVSQKISQGAKESTEPKKRGSTARKRGKKGDQPDAASLLQQLDGGERPANILTPVGSTLPTLNFSAFQHASFQQPFTDLQHLQLRAQIFVYGSLIQGNAPDEGCLKSAFGGPDGGKGLWEKPWRKCLERIHNQISQTNLKSPAQQSSGRSTPNQTTKRKRNAPLGSAGVNPMIPLSSPSWNVHNTIPDGLQISEIHRASLVDHIPLPPLYPFQSPEKSTGHVNTWSSHASHPLPSVSSAQSSPWDPNISFSVFPGAEPVKLIPVKESSLIPYIDAYHSSAGPSPSSIAAPAISSEIVGETQVYKSLGQTAIESKAKKPKKVPVSNKASQILEPASHSIEPVLYSDRIFTEDKDAGKNETASEDTLHRVDEAKFHAEEAAACADAAVSHIRHVWDQLEKQKNSGLPAGLENKVASAAVAIAAAVTVAKAAAAAARLASEAAMQAKLMAEESLVSSERIKAGSVNGVALSNGVNLLDEVTPASILKGENSSNISTSIIGAAKEAAKRKLESALSASNHAKNLDAIVKAAELAAEAVAQAGRVVAMGDPLPVSALVLSGPEGCWKLFQQPPERIAISNLVKETSLNNEANGAHLSFSKTSQDGNLISQPSQHSKSENQPAPELASLKNVDAQMTTADPVSASNGNKDSNANAVVCPELVCEKKSPSPMSSCQESENLVEISINNHMEEGSVVEVFKEWGPVKAAWFAARVLELKDDEVCVSYIEKQAGGGEYKEWITLSSEDNTAPIVRIAHPVTIVPSDGARKRRRSAIGRCSWEVGDKVDAWMQDCWWEGLIIEKNGKDGLSLTVQFPAQGDTCVVKAWNLRPSLIWKDGAWVQWSNPSESVRSRHENDTPMGKRQRLNNPQVDVKVKDKVPESCLVGLSEKETKFNVGKSSRDDAKVNAHRMVRTGLREGSKVIFGVPKPGKKRKFMDVGNSNEPRKTSRIPISQGPHGWKNINPRTVAQQKTSRSKPKDSSAISAPSEVDEGIELGHAADNDSASGTEKQADPESCSVADEATDEVTDDSILISSLARPTRDPSSKRSALRNTKSERASRGKLGLSNAKKAKVKEDNVLSETTHQEAPDAAEPRRSNRRIQPTSRLLEGLQTSLSIAKVPSAAIRK